MRVALLITMLGCARPSPVGTETPMPSAMRIASNKNAQVDSELMKPCIPGSVAHIMASAALQKLGKKIKALGPSDDTTRVNGEMKTLLATPCFLLAAMHTGSSLEADSAYSLKLFWENGGRRWLSFPLHTSESRSVVTAPTMRKPLRIDHPLTCVSKDSRCGLVTRSWHARAERTLTLMAERRRLDTVMEEEDLHPTKAKCTQEALQQKPELRISYWLDCVNTLPIKRMALPLGNSRAPTTGWLLIRGRRGHYNFCDEVRAYHVTTGSAFVASSCSDLALNSDGTVDGVRTESNRKLLVQQGVIPVDILREAVWMILMSNEAQPNVMEAISYTLPQVLKLEFGTSSVGSSIGGIVGLNTDQTRLDWKYLPDGSSGASGTLIWPREHDNDAKDYAVQLLRDAESVMIEGCAVTGPPRDLNFHRYPSSGSSVDVSEGKVLPRIEGELLNAIKAQKPKHGC